MSEPFIGEIRIFAGNYAPRGWAFCDGQELDIGQNQLLYFIIQEIYGLTLHPTIFFRLPDMRGRAPMHINYSVFEAPMCNLGQYQGDSEVHLHLYHLPKHGHSVRTNKSGGQTSPINMYPEDGYAADSANADSGVVVSQVGNNQPHNNMQPYLALNFIIALTGILPDRN